VCVQQAGVRQHRLKVVMVLFKLWVALMLS
jgi:hypothetical protein